MTLSPYFKSMAAQKRMCPDCFGQTYIEESDVHNPNVAIEHCDCGYIQVLCAPKAAEVRWDEDHPWDGITPDEWHRETLKGRWPRSYEELMEDKKLRIVAAAANYHRQVKVEYRKPWD